MRAVVKMQREIHKSGLGKGAPKESGLAARARKDAIRCAAINAGDSRDNERSSDSKRNQDTVIGKATRNTGHET